MENSELSCLTRSVPQTQCASTFNHCSHHKDTNYLTSGPKAWFIGQAQELYLFWYRIVGQHTLIWHHIVFPSQWDTLSHLIQKLLLLVPYQLKPPKLSHPAFDRIRLKGNLMENSCTLFNNCFWKINMLKRFLAIEKTHWNFGTFSCGHLFRFCFTETCL